MKPFEFLLGEETAHQLLQLPAEEQRHALMAIESVAKHPATSGLPCWEAEDRRMHFLKQVHGWQVTFWVDHADRAVRIVAIDEA